MILKEEQTKEIVNRLKEALQPTVIYLFGSQVQGEPGSGSDVDLCVVVPDDSEDTYRKTVKAYRCLRNLRFPKDLLVRHQSKFETRSQWRGAIEREIAQSGRIVYRSET